MLPVLKVPWAELSFLGFTFGLFQTGTQGGNRVHPLQGHTSRKILGRTFQEGPGNKPPAGVTRFTPGGLAATYPGFFGGGLQPGVVGNKGAPFFLAEKAFFSRGIFEPLFFKRGGYNPGC